MIFKVTAKLYKQKQERDIKAKEEYVEINPYTFKAYYEKKSDILEHEKHSTLYYLLYDFRIPIIFGIFWITGYSVYYSVYKIDENKQKLSEIKFVNKGSGYTVKTLPINIV